MGREAALQVVGRGVVDRGRTQQPRGADPDVQAAKGRQDLVEQRDCVLLVGDVEGVGDDFGAWVRGGEGVGQRGVGVGVGGFVTGCSGLACV